MQKNYKSFLFETCAGPRNTRGCSRAAYKELLFALKNLIIEGTFATRNRV